MLTLKQFYDNKQYKQSIRNAEQILEKHPDHPGTHLSSSYAHRNIGYACSQHERSEEAGRGFRVHQEGTIQEPR